MGELTICTFNARGLTNNVKRKDVFNWLQKKSFSIYCIQEFHGNAKIENIYKTEWGNECFL